MMDWELVVKIAGRWSWLYPDCPCNSKYYNLDDRAGSMNQAKPSSEIDFNLWEDQHG
jgi:hypothetical protein